MGATQQSLVQSNSEIFRVDIMKTCYTGSQKSYLIRGDRCSTLCHCIFFPHFFPSPWIPHLFKSLPFKTDSLPSSPRGLSPCQPVTCTALMLPYFHHGILWLRNPEKFPLTSLSLSNNACLPFLYFFYITALKKIKRSAATHQLCGGDTATAMVSSSNFLIPRLLTFSLL